MEDFKPPSGYGHSAFFIIIFFTILFNALLIAYCVRKKREENEARIQSQVQLQVEKYFKLETNPSME